MDDKRLVKTSKYLSRHLRHQPQRLGLTLDPGGWTSVSALLEACARRSFALSLEELHEVVDRNDKQRFAFDATGTRIRANQGHSVDIDLGLIAEPPPPLLFHGTARAFVSAILDSGGLRPGKRHHGTSARTSIRPCASGAATARRWCWRSTRRACTNGAIGSSSPPTACGSPMWFPRNFSRRVTMDPRAITHFVKGDETRTRGRLDQK